MNALKFLIAILFLANSVHAQDNYTNSVEYEKRAMNNYLKKNYELFLTDIKKAETFRPNHPRLIYNLAAAYSLNNYKKEALNELQKLINMGLYFPVEKDSDFIAFQTDPGFIDIINKFKKNLEPEGNSKTAFEYPEKDLITESIAFDPVQNKFYLSSVYRRKIVWYDENGNTGNFKNEGEDGLWSVFGIKIDSGRRLLWVCTGAIKQTRNFTEKDLGKSSVFKYNIDSKQLIKKYELGNIPDGHLLGDLALSPAGDVYVSDSRYNAVYKISANSDSLEMFIEPDKFVSLQGVDLSNDGRYLFLADYSRGLFKVNLKSKEIEHIKSPSNFTPLGIDGLYFYQNSLIATQNGINPQRVVRIYLNKNFDGVKKYAVLESNNPDFDEITLGLIKGNSFYYIANSQWGSLDKDGNIFPVEKMKKPRILKLMLSGN